LGAVADIISASWLVSCELIGLRAIG